jgi:multiple sugar transport system permease protein
MKIRMPLGKAVATLLLITGALVFVYPFLWMLLTSFKLEKDVLAFPPSLINRTFTLDGYAGIWTRVSFFRYFLNTVAFATGVTTLSLLLDTMAGYAFARLRFKGRSALFLMVLVTLMIPFQVIMVPLYYEVFKLGLLNTYLGLILPRATNAFGIFMMRQFFVSLPTGLEEAARIDGCSEFKIFRSIMLPLCRPAVISLAIFHFMYNWNDLLYPLVLVTGSDMYTLSSGLAMFMGTHVVEYALLMAGGVLTLLPIFIAYCGAQK